MRSLHTEVQYLKGVGPRVAEVFAKIKVFTVEDLLYYFPRRYEDRSNLPPIGQVRPGEYVTVCGKIVDVETSSMGRRLRVTRAVIEDQTGSICLQWFNQPWLQEKLMKHRGTLLAYGCVKESGLGYEIGAPEWELLEPETDLTEFACIVPIYPLTEGLAQKQIQKAVRSALASYLDSIEDPLGDEIKKQYDLRLLRWSIEQIHWPQSEQYRLEARKRLVFDEFFVLQLALQHKRAQTQRQKGISFVFSDSQKPHEQAPPDRVPNLFSHSFQTMSREQLWKEIKTILPFSLTSAQKRVIQEILADMEQEYPMNRLVQGDVGSGKTIVAACVMLAAVRCGYQAALMAPTEILAEQHYLNLRKLFSPLEIHIELLLGKQKGSVKEKVIHALSEGRAKICVGTHALIQENVQFSKLGLAIIDEQHRFGVLQRAALRSKGLGNPDVLVMTATPIPRTLTMTLYGDLDLSVIDELPAGRKPIKTYWKLSHERPLVYQGVKKLLEENRQIYFVCPMISENEKMQTQAAEDLYYRLSAIEFSDKRVGLLHGQMKPEKKDEVMEQFRRHEIDILVSTVVIEVGVDVPNASVMVIEDAHRFGLSQLHQLRGRVGRGLHQSYCILIGEAKTEESKKRLEVLTQTSDGFKISEEDLKMRGPGELIGTRQSGNLDFKLADLIQDGKMLEVARQAALDVLKKDPHLKSKEHQKLLQKTETLSSKEFLIPIS